MSYLVPHHQQRLHQQQPGHGYSQFRRPTVTRPNAVNTLERTPSADNYNGKVSADPKKKPGMVKRALKYALYGLGAYMLYKLAKVINPFKAKAPAAT